MIIPKDVSVPRFRVVLLTAASRAGVIEPAELREPVRLWLRAVEEQAYREHWRSLLGRNCAAAWGAAVSILDAAGVSLPDEP